MKRKTKGVLFALVEGLVWIVIAIALAWGFYNDAQAEEKKPRVEHVYSLITWYDAIPPYTNEFIWKTERKCRQWRTRINGILEPYKDDPKFGWIGECTKRVRP